MILLRNISIKRRLTLIIMFVSIASVSITTLTISLIGYKTLQADLLTQLEVSASIVGDRNAAALRFGQNDMATNNLGAVFTVQPAIVQACLYDPTGKPFANYTGENFSGIHCPASMDTHSEIGSVHAEVLQSIINAGDRVGYIFIESTLDQLDQYIRKQIIIALTVASATLLVSYMLAVNLQHTISRPILNLADTARQVSIQKDYNIRAKMIGDAKKEDKNELVILTDSFNEMLTEIGARDRQLKTQNVALEKARDAAESANRAKSQFLANISHELRTPLNAIIGFSSILMNQLFGTLGDPKYLEYAKDINDSGAHLLDIINDILDLSKAEAGKLTLAYEEVHIGKAINKSITILTDRATKGNITITTDVPKMLPPLAVDRLRFIQILLNILSNAVKFTEPGGKVHIAVCTDEGNPAQFIITVEDTGIGMSQEDIDKAFQSFGQVDSGLNRKYEGTGLGLPLTKKLMELHHGAISIKSTLGKGTLVTLALPAAPPAGVEYKAE